MKKGQVTIFIIVAVILVAAIAAIFFVRTGTLPGVGKKIEKNPQAFMSVCLEDQMRENINKMVSQGGFIEPVNYKIHNDIKATYLCDHIGNYQPCINQHPMLLSKVSVDLQDSIAPYIEDCFLDFEESLEDQGYEINMDEDFQMELNLVPGRVNVNLIRDMTITRAEDVSNYEEVQLIYPTSLYNLARIAMDIVNEEATTCFFGHLNFMAVNPEYLIQLKVFSDSTKVYSIQDKKTFEEMNIAIRGCGLT